MTVRGTATRQRLIEATRTVVREVGYAHASTRLIAQAAGVAEGTIYRHFPTKSALFFAAVLEANAPIVDRLVSLPERAGQATVEANLTDVMVQLAGLRQDVMPLEMAIAADPELSAERRRALESGSPQLPGPPEAMAAYLAAEQRLGRIRDEIDPREAASLILGALFALGADPTLGDAGPDSDRIASVVRLLVHGLAPASRTERTGQG